MGPQPHRGDRSRQDGVGQDGGQPRVGGGRVGESPRQPQRSVALASTSRRQLTLVGLTGKTEVFSTQIEALQQELQPWAAKIAAKQGEIDLAANERDLLTEKTEAVKNGIEEAEAALEKLSGDDSTKVRSVLPDSGTTD